MRSRKNDIRVSRKFVPNPIAIKPEIRGRCIRPTRSTKPSLRDGVIEETSTLNHDGENDSTKGSRMSTSKKTVGSSRMGSTQKLKVLSESKQRRNEFDDNSLVSPDQKRKRSGAENYINKRFLYDVVEPPKRRQKKFLHFSDRSTAALMAVSSANLLRRHKSKTRVSRQQSGGRDLFSHVRSRHGRRLKPKHDYSPSQSDNEHSVYNPSFVADSRRRIRKKVLAPTVKPRLNSKLERNNWPRSNECNKDFYSSDEQDDDELDVIISPKDYYAGASCLPTYTDVFNDIQKRGNIPQDETSDFVDNYGRPDPCGLKNRVNSRRVLSPNNNQKGPTNSFLHPPVFREDGISSAVDHHPSDILDFCAGSNSEQFSRGETASEEINGQEDDVGLTESRGLISRRVQQAQDDLEEDLLAPELSLITGPSTVANPDGILVSTLTDTGTVLSCSSASGSSRRKSPVRPMQVLRTVYTSTSAPTIASPAMLVTGSENSPFVFTSSVVANTMYTRPSGIELGHDGGDMLPSGMCSVLPDNNTQSFNEPNQSMENSFSMSISDLKIHSLGDQSHQIPSSAPPSTLTSLTSVAQVSVSSDGASGSKGNTAVSSGLLPSLLTQSNTRPVSVVPQPIISRVFMAPSTTRSVTTPVTKPVLSVSHPTVNSVSARRRPTILRRALGSGIGAPANSLITSRTVFETSNTDSDQTTSCSSRPVTVFNSNGASQQQKPISLITTEEPGPSTSLNTATPKLLQLVTTSSTPSDCLNPNQTASDRLFGKRPAAYNKVPSHTPTTVPNTSQNSGTIHQSPTPTNTSINTTTPYRYAVVRGSADGKQYVLISNPRVVDQPAHDQPVVTVSTSATTNSTLEPTYVQTSIVSKNHNSEQLFPPESCIARAFKVEINGAHLIRMNSDGHSIAGSDRQFRTIYTTPQGATTMAAT
ncbi:unnamed protein product [Trichobilharzia szidati]|nr:unnamed protein product [Trichobilharzia szidati]